MSKKGYGYNLKTWFNNQFGKTSIEPPLEVKAESPKIETAKKK